MPQPVNTAGRMRTYVGAELREGNCELCGTKTEKIMTEFTDASGRVREALRPICPRCGAKGRLIVKHISVQPPSPPACLSPRCLVRFLGDCLFSALVASYHRRRVAYASQNRNKVMLERYRTGMPSPQNIWQAIHAIIKLRCPVCRKYNVDPLLFRR